VSTDELLKELLRGRLLLVGEYRGSRAEMSGYVDRKSGDAIRYVRAIHLVECACRGNLDRAMIYQRLPEAVEKPDEVVFPYVKGSFYVFFLVSCKWDNGQVICSMSDRQAEQIELLNDGKSGEPVAAPSGAAIGRRPNLVC
jgi:hypothetical protein